jgi:hypothetical protein
MSIMEGVKEYSEGMVVELVVHKGRLVIRAYNEGGYNCTDVDALQLVGWLRVHRPDILDTN